MENFAGNLVRAARKRRALTQHQLEARSGIKQANIAALEVHAGDRTALMTVSRLLAAAGEQLAALPSREPTAAETAQRISAAIGQGNRDRALRQLIVFHDGLVASDPAVRVALSVSEPLPTGDAGWDAVLAAVVDHDLGRAPKPTWTAARVTKDWFLDDRSPVSIRPHIRDHTPTAFRRHGVWVHVDDLESV